MKNGNLLLKNKKTEKTLKTLISKRYIEFL